MSTSPSGFVRRLFWLGLIAAALPLGLQMALFVWGRPTGAAPASLVGALIAGSAGALALGAVSWFVARRFWTSVSDALGSVHESTLKARNEDFNTRSKVAGPSLELAALGKEFDGLLEHQQRTLLSLNLERKQAATLLASARTLIEECIYAREPLAKQHPGLAAAYAAAAIREAGSQKESENHTVDGLVSGVDGVGQSHGNRENLRWTPTDVRVDVPMPSKLVNMSVSGMAVESNRGLPVGGSWVFQVGAGSISYEIPGKICWCRLQRTVKIDDEVRPIYHTGVEFDDLLSGKAFDFFGPASLEQSVALAP